MRLLFALIFVLKYFISVSQITGVQLGAGFFKPIQFTSESGSEELKKSSSGNALGKRLTFTYQISFNIKNRPFSLGYNRVPIGNGISLRLQDELFTSAGALRARHYRGRDYNQITLLTQLLVQRTINLKYLHIKPILYAGLAVNQSRGHRTLETMGKEYGNAGGPQDYLILSFDYSFFNQIGTGIVFDYRLEGAAKKRYHSRLYAAFRAHIGLVNLASGKIDIDANGYKAQQKFVSTGSYLGAYLGYYIYSKSRSSIERAP
ncbi:MAG TPA: hypothetical protein VFV37_05615 [Luteibaculaceae bacterium]|nr:hypothetical protein [Luteibaculaceae bacterium]